MKIVTTAGFLHFFVCATAAVSDSDATETALEAAPGDIATLPCYAVGNVTPILTTWVKDGQEVARSDPTAQSPSPAAQRVTVTNDGSLRIGRVAPGDEGTYGCSSTLPGNNTFHARVSLHVNSPENVSTSIVPATALSNGTLVVLRGSSVSFHCSGSSSPSQRLTWSFSGASSSNESLASATASSLDFRIEDVQPGAQGVYSCGAHDAVSGQALNRSTELLVYYVPDRHPDCAWALEQDPSYVWFNCTWPGAYPTPALRWGDDDDVDDPADHGMRTLYTSDLAESLPLRLNRSALSDGQALRCAARHPALAAGTEMSCSFLLKSPYPLGEPLVTALAATSVTLTCTEDASLPPANTAWRKGLHQEAIVPGSKYAVSKDGPACRLTIRDVAEEDEGVYFCRSENPLAVRELEVYLTVKTSSAYTGVILGVFIAALIVGAAAIVAKTLYSNRHRMCLGDGFGQMEEDRGDVLSLVESDDEQLFRDAVPQLPPLANGHQTTLVLIHRIPSSDREDAETADTSPQEDTAQTEEPGDLVTF
ncbi:vsig10 [Pungitius sinensis]